MNHIKKFKKFVLEGALAPAPVKPDVDTPSKPSKPKPKYPIIRPSIDPKPKAKKDSDGVFTEEDLAKRFISELKNKDQNNA